MEGGALRRWAFCNCSRAGLVGTRAFIQRYFPEPCNFLFAFSVHSPLPAPRSRKTPRALPTAKCSGVRLPYRRAKPRLPGASPPCRSKNYTVAYQEFKTAVAYLPDAVVSGRAHDEAADGVCKSGTVLAEARIAQGDYAGAEAILNEILTRYDPNCRKAQELLAHMRQPGYFNKTVDAGFINKVEEVKRLLAEADGFYQSGQYDKAMKRYDQVLTLDPYNTAARRGQERIDNTKYQYGEEAYNETRARQLWKVEEAWQQPVRKIRCRWPGR